MLVLHNTHNNIQICQFYTRTHTITDKYVSITQHKITRKYFSIKQHTITHKYVRITQ